MKLEPGRTTYPIEQRGHVTAIHLDIGGRGRGGECFVLMPVSPATMCGFLDGASGQLCGFPQYGTFTGEHIAVWPAPDGAYDLIVTMQPPEVTL